MKKTQQAKVTATRKHLTITCTVREGRAFRTSAYRVDLDALSQVDLEVLGLAIDDEVKRRLRMLWQGGQDPLPF